MKLAVIKQRRLWWIISSLVIMVGLVAMAISWQQFGTPLKPGLDFAGGTRLQLTRSCNYSSTSSWALRELMTVELIHA